MRHIQLTLTGLCIVLVASVAVAKDKKAEKPMDPQAMMEIYAQLAKPGEPHRQFASLAGSWTTKTKEWMEPNKPPMESTGSAEMKMLLNGRFSQQEFTGDMTTPSGRRGMCFKPWPTARSPCCRTHLLGQDLGHADR